GSKHTVEAFAMALSKELQEFNVEVSTINPGPYLTGFNDREFETWKNWEIDLDDTVFDYRKTAFPSEQFDPEEVTEPAIKVILGETDQYRNVIPEKWFLSCKKPSQLYGTKKQAKDLASVTNQYKNLMTLNRERRQNNSKKHGD